MGNHFVPCQVLFLLSCNRQKTSSPLVPVILEHCMWELKAGSFKVFFSALKYCVMFSQSQSVDGIITVLLNTKINIERKTFLLLSSFTFFSQFYFYCSLNSCLNSFLFLRMLCAFTQSLALGIYYLCFPFERNR